MCACLGLTKGQIKLKTFSDGEINLQLMENVRGADCFVVQPTCSPVEFHLMELLCMMDALKRSSAERITAVIPYYGYGRQDRKDKPRVPISAKLVASLLETAGADRIMALDLHAAQIQGFFDVPVDHLFFRPVIIDYFKPQNTPDLTVVSPDAGGVERARSVAKRLNAPLAIIDKRREEANVAEVMNVIGEVEGKNCLIVDDLIDTAGTLVKGAEALLEHGAKTVSACATHAVLSGPAVERIRNSAIQEVVFSSSIPLSEQAKAGESGTVDARGDLGQHLIPVAEAGSKPHRQSEIAARTSGAHTGHIKTKFVPRPKGRQSETVHTAGHGS
jgi:ribose-phosphate pyrophosphokinase